jgi:hypothetical protein
MSEPNNGQMQDKRLIPQGDQRRYTGEILLRTRPKTYHAIARELAEPNASVNGIARRYRVSNHTVMGIRAREAKTIAERKKTLAAMLASVAELGAARMEETIGKAKLRDAAIGTGIAVDKMCQLTDKAAPNMNIAIVSMPTPEERELLNECHRRLRAVAIGESQDPSADVAWIVAYSKWEESGGPQLLAKQPAQ